MKKLLLTLTLIAILTTATAQWTSQATGFISASRGLSQVHIVDANTVWGLAYDGSAPTPPETTNPDPQEFTRTTNGGISWTAGSIDVGNSEFSINNLSPVSATTAWVSALIPTDGKGVIYKTTDAGLSWNRQLATGFQATASFLNSVYFFDADNGIAYGDPIGSGVGEFEVYKTTNGGTTWTLVPAASLPNPLNNEYGYNSAPTAIGTTLWFTTNRGRIYRTSDMGTTWSVFQAPIADFGSAAENGTIEFSTTSIGCLLKAVGTTYTFYTTTNGGTTWSAGAAFTGTRRILTYIPETTTIVATSQSAPVGTSVSTNNGASWTNVESAEQRGATAFLNATTAWSAGFSTNGVEDGIFRLTGTLGTSRFETTAFKVYPNPATSLITIAATDVATYQLSVTDLSGKTVMTATLNGIENTIDISALSSGAYFFELRSDSKKEVVKILKN